MGTTMSFLYVKNRPFAQGELSAGIRHFAGEEQKKNKAYLELFRPFLPADAVGRIASSQRRKTPKAALAYSESAVWLPLFLESLCEGNITSSDELLPISSQLHTPALAFSVYDSDALFVSYCDGKSGAAHDYVKPNFPQFEEFDSTKYRAAFPAFLSELCGEANRGRLVAVWNAENVVFADDRLSKLAELMELPVIYDFNEERSGFRRIPAK